jgi:hypothetical protein
MDINALTRIRCIRTDCVNNHHGICYAKIIYINKGHKCESYERKPKK